MSGHASAQASTLRRGTLRYTAPADAAGTDTVRYRVKLRDGRRRTGTIRIRIKQRSARGTPPAPAPQPPAPTPAPQPPAPKGDGLPAPLPAVPGSVAATTRNWVPTTYDTCSQQLHERFSVVGPDGRRYPTWHPPTVTDPATGTTCTFGHEHGTDPRSSQIYAWALTHFANATYPAHAGLPFGLAAEALNTWADANATPKRSEDHVGYKVDVANDVALLGADGAKLGVTCDHLTIVHQGSHSPDALSNNVHELLYAVRCDDGTDVIADTISRFGNPGEYTRSCEPGVKVATTDNGYPDGAGERLIPDRTCVVETRSSRGPERTFTYRQINESSNQLAHHFLANGCQVGDVVAIYAYRGSVALSPPPRSTIPRTAADTLAASISSSQIR